MNTMKDVEGVEETRFQTYKAYFSMGNNSVKKSSIKNHKPYAHLHIIGRQSTKFQMNPINDVGGDAETRSGLAKFKSAWAITLSKKRQTTIQKTTCTFSYHRKKVLKISNQSNERCRRSCGDKIMVGKV